MSRYRPHPPAAPLLFGYDPVRDLSDNHLARLVDAVVEECVHPAPKIQGRGQSQYDPRLLVKVLVYAYATGVRSSRVMERQCTENLCYLFLTRGEHPSYRTLCTARVQLQAEMEAVWVGLFAVADACELQRLGRITLDSTKLAANASPDAVVAAKNYAPVLALLHRIQQEAKERDEQEDRQEDDPGGPGANQLDKVIPTEQMRDILRRVRREQREKATDAPAPEPKRRYTPRMLARIQSACEAIEQAQQTGQKHVCLADPDARMMYGGRVRCTRECHSFEVAVDNETGLLVAAQSEQEAHDSSRLAPLVQAAQEQGPVVAVDADSGYYSGEGVSALLQEGMDVCIPSPGTAHDLHHGQPVGSFLQGLSKGTFAYEATTDTYTCPAGALLLRTQDRQHYGQRVRCYQCTADCQACEHRDTCLVHPSAKHRTLKVGVDHDRLVTEQLRFGQRAHQQRYHRRSDQVETVFGFLRGTLGYRQWLLRGAQRVAQEARLFALAYQVRKLQAFRLANA